MSKISLSPDVAGTGIFTIASPNSNTNRTLTLPDDTGTLALTSAALTGTTDSGTPFETALGSGAGAVNTGVRNVFVGFEAGNDNTTGVDNTAVGYQALDANTTGQRNTAVGTNALTSSTTAQYNTAIGYNALSSNTTGEFNTSVGDASLLTNTTGANNTAVGQGALNANTTGANNTAVGKSALDANTTGITNTAVGTNALGAVTTGSRNNAFGSDSSPALTTGNNNVTMGASSGQSLTTGSNNIAIGYDAATDAVFNLTTESNRIVMGNNSHTNAYIKIAWTVTSDARDKTSVEPVPHGLSFVQQLNPVSYRWKTSREDDTPHGNKRYGFLAQDILAIEGENPVIIDNEEPEHLKYQGEALVPVLVNAIKELSAQVTALQAEVNTLKGQ
jgi:trimeric autotransporter adhesin